MGGKFLLGSVLLAGGILLAGQAQAEFPSVPKETYEALKIERSASPKELYEALVKRYLDPEVGVGKGVFGQYWEPVTFSKYFDPHTFYKPPQAVKEVASREQ
jgi:hydroxylamine dehydrogenase